VFPACCQVSVTSGISRFTWRADSQATFT
jgi:hypothetical protein